MKCKVFIYIIDIKDSPFYRYFEELFYPITGHQINATCTKIFKFPCGCNKACQMNRYCIINEENNQTSFTHVHIVQGLLLGHQYFST